MKMRTALAAALTVLAIPASAQAGYELPEIVTAPGPGTALPTIVGSDASLGNVYFLTADDIDPADTDGVADVYRRTTGGGLTLITENVDQPVTAAMLSANGAWLAWQTATPVDAGDADGGIEDVYRTDLTNGSVAWISQGGNSVLYGSALRGVGDNGAVFLTTAENLGVDDFDSEGGADAYRGTGASAPTLLSGPSSIASVTIERVARDGSAAIIRTTESLSADDDTDGAADLYYAAPGVLTLISDSGLNPDPNTAAGFVAAATPNLDVVFFYTAEPLEPTGADLGGTDDVYRWAGAAPVLATGTGAGAVQSGFASADGTRFWFHTSIALVAGDINAGTDVYEYRSATDSLHLISNGTGFGALVAGAAGGRVFFTTTDDYGDGDQGEDVYESAGGVVTLKSPGSPGNISWAGASGDGSRVFYESLDQVVAEDADVERDVYTTENGAPALVSRGGDGSEGVQFDTSNADGSRVLVQTHEALVGADTDINGSDHYLARLAPGAAPTPPADPAPADPPVDAPPQDGPPATTDPIPVEGKLFNAAPVSGMVLVRIAGSTAFVKLTDLRSIPNGSLVDARNGRVRLFTTDGKGGIQFSDFYGGMFKITQRKGGLVELALAGGSFKGCPAPKAARRATAAIGKSVRKLWGSGKGKFRTAGRFASATVRGTTWLTDDRCDGTLVKVTEGAVVARDLVKRKSVLLRAKKQYFAAAKKAGAARRRR